MRSISLTIVLLVSGAAATVAQAPTLTPLTMFGCDDCTGPTLFATVHALAIAGDGSIMIADGNDPRIRIFNAQGNYQRGLGRTGAGPGELRLPVGVGTLDGTLVAVDMTNQRITRYSPDGETRSTHRTDALPTSAAFPPHGGPPLIGLSRFTGPEIALARFRADSLVEVRRVGAAEFPERVAGNFELLAIAVAPDGSFAVGDGIGAYRILRYSADGAPQGAIVRDISRARLSAQEMRELTEQRDRNLSRTRARVAAENRSAAASFTPPPVREERNFFNFRALAFDERGRLWVRVERGPLEVTAFDVFDGAGRYLGAVRVAARVRDFALGAGMLAAVTLDELDVPRIAVWRVQ